MGCPCCALLCCAEAASAACSSRRCCYPGAWQASARQLATHAFAAAPEIFSSPRPVDPQLHAGHSLTCCRLRWVRRLLALSPTVSCCRNAFAASLCADAASACVQLPSRLRSPRRISLVPTRALHRRKRRCSCADTPLVTTLSFPTVRRLPQRTLLRGEACSQATRRIRR